MANPFLFDEPAAEPVNPFLMNDAPAEPANPFLMDGGGMGGAMQPQANFAAPDAANPFASYAAPMYNDPNAQMGNYYYQQQQQQSAFLAQQHQQQSYASPHHQQAFVQPQQQQQQQAHSHSHNQHLQQFAGQYGTYTQVTADSFSQPAVSSAFATQQPAEQVSQAAVTAACFTAPAAPLTGAALFGVVETVEEPAIVSAPVVQEVEMVAVELPPPPPAEIIEEPAPPPPPPVPAEEDTMSLPPPPAAEVLPQVADEPLPAPPEETMTPVKQQASEDDDVEINFGAKQPEPDLADEDVQPPAQDSFDGPKEEGFGQIFSKPITPPSEPELAVAMVDPDLPGTNTIKPFSYTC